MKIGVVSFYHNNMDKRVVEAQKSVFDYFKIPVKQILTELSHPEAMEDFIKSTDLDAYVFFDIDCIPLHKDVVLNAIKSVYQKLCVYGAAQKANHIKDSEVYVSPAFMAITKYTYKAIGSPSFKSNANHDVASQITEAAKYHNIRIEMLWPSHVENPKWHLRGNVMFGNGTTYENEVYHAFESRMNQSTSMFIKKCKEVTK